MSNINLNLINVYRPPSSESEVDILLYTELSRISEGYTIILGDFNCPNINYDLLDADAEGKRLLKFLGDSFLFQINDCPTRGNNILDLLIVSHLNLVKRFEVIEPIGKSDHNMLKFIINVENKICNNHLKVPDFKNANFNDFKDSLSSYDWDEILLGNVNIMWNTFLQIFNEKGKVFVPYKMKRAFTNSKPRWWNNEIRDSLGNRNRAYKLWKSSPTVENNNIYIAWRRNCKRLIRYFKRNFEINIARESKNNPKKFYNYVNNKSSIKESIGPVLDNNGNLKSNNVEVANILNNFFSSVFTKENLDNVPSMQDIKDFYIDNILDTFEIFEEEVAFQIDKLLINKSPGPDGLYPVHLKSLKDILVKPLTKLFNESLQQGIVPHDFKLANITPIFKKGDHKLPNNYRPISLTSIVGKIFEAILASRLVGHLEDHELLNNSQHGFRKNRSCLTNLLEFFNEVINNVDNHKSYDVIYLDFQKAFDTVPHQRLLEKLRAHGIRGKFLNWIKNWLFDRRQRVVINGECSEWVNVISGVPQGSVLGPILFIVYVNDIDKNVLSNISKFADDTKIGNRITCENDYQVLQSDSNKIVNWSKTWQMKFNIDKCKVLHFGSRNIEYNYVIDDSDINVVDEEKDLGVLISKDLKFAKQCADPVKKANKALGFIARNFEYKSKNIILPLYKSLLRPHLEYAVQFWSPYLKKDIDKIERIQKRATKLIPELRGKSYVQRLRELDIHSLETRRLKGKLIEVFKILNKFDNVDYKQYFRYDLNDLTRSNGQKLSHKRFQTNIAKNFFTYDVIEKWNSPSHQIVNSDNIESFKKKLDAHFKQIGL
ncbi:UNVERIFIED_CONTAM: hypothetical protein RMT77_019088 [Armadillidium vulgare]